LIGLLWQNQGGRASGRESDGSRFRKATSRYRFVVLAACALLFALVPFIRGWTTAFEAKSTGPADAGQTLSAGESAGPGVIASLSIYAGNGESGHTNGTAAAARFAGPFGLGLDNGATLYVADTGNHRIRSVGPTGLVLDVAGSGIEGFADGPRAEAQFSSPNAVTVGPDGTIYVADAGNLRIRAIGPSGIVSTLAGSGVAGYVDGVGMEAQFPILGAIVAGPDGVMYVPDRLNNIIRRVTPSGVVSTFAGTGIRGHVDGPREAAQFNVPMRMGGVDSGGNVYVLDTGDNYVRKISPEGTVSTVAGSAVAGFADGTVREAQFSSDILGLTSDAPGNVYVMDAGNHRVRLVTPEGIVSTLFEFTDLNHAPGNIKRDAAGNFYLSDRQHNVIIS
jgi:serine/threonine-protein kinase